MTYTRDLLNLIKCSGYAGTSGQSFRNNVTGAASGTKMSDYKVTDWIWDGLPVLGRDWSSGTVFTVSADIIGGSKASNIIKQGAGLIAISPVSVPEGGSATVDCSVSGLSIAGTITIVGGHPESTGALLTGNAVVLNDISGDAPAHVLFKGVLGSGASSDGLSQEFTLALSFPNMNTGTGSFNPDLGAGGTTQFQVSITDRDYDITDFTQEWYSDSGYTTLVGDGTGVDWTDPGVGGNYTPGPWSKTYYMRWRMHPTDSWTNFGAVTYNEDRR